MNIQKKKSSAPHPENIAEPRVSFELLFILLAGADGKIKTRHEMIAAFQLNTHTNSSCSHSGEREDKIHKLTIES